MTRDWCAERSGVSDHVMSIDWNLQIHRLNYISMTLHDFLIPIFCCGGGGVGFFFRMRSGEGRGEHGMLFKLFVRGRSLTL